jgi:non-homologous end joining protein Ku
MKATSTHLLAVTTEIDPVTGDAKPLFAFPVQVCAASDDKEIRLDVAAPSGMARKQQYIDPATGEVVDDADCLRGVRLSKTEFKAIPKGEIEKINEATKLGTLTVTGSMNLADVPFERQMNASYLQVPPLSSPKAYRLVYESLIELRTASGKTVVRPAKAITGKRTVTTRQKPCVIWADEERECLMLSDLKFAASVREPDEQILAPLQVEVDGAMIDSARQVIDALGDGLQALNTCEDDAIKLRQKLIDQALAGETITAVETVATPDPQIVANLEDLLARSLATV